ncbi:hypothetical protein A9R00_03750 [Oleispira antarctica]|uniref:Lipoprotein n=1 Tax=Oleispira antarctica TaxID=188908 RepID=A0A1Y5HY92_OLEAN|nr:hypothetical protein A9R00_03750 [Oleispira antarctica]
MPFKLIASSVCLVLLLGCVEKEDDEELKTSSDFATSEIEVHYAVEVMVDEEAVENTVHFYANFYGNGQALELTGEDEVSVAINSTSEPLLSEESTGIANYRLVETVDAVAPHYIFDLTRTEQSNAPSSMVIIPQAFQPTHPVASTAVYAVDNAFLLQWQNVGAVDEVDPEAVIDSKQFTVRYDFDCRNGNSNSTAVGSYVEKFIEDDGEHTVNLNKVFGIQSGGSSFGRCGRFDITLIRSDSNDRLDPGLLGGSTVGAQVRYVRELTIEDIL